MDHPATSRTSRAAIGMAILLSVLALLGASNTVLARSPTHVAAPAG